MPSNLPKHWEYSREQTEKNFWPSRSLHSNLLKWVISYFLHDLTLFSVLMTFHHPSLESGTVPLHNFKATGPHWKRGVRRDSPDWGLRKVMPGLGAQLAFSSAGAHVLPCSAVFYVPRRAVSVVIYTCLWLCRLICLILQSGCIYKPHSVTSTPSVGEKGDLVSWLPYSFVWYFSWLWTWSWKRNAIYWALSNAKRSSPCTVTFYIHSRQCLIRG